MRDLVETVIAEVMRRHPSPPDLPATPSRPVIRDRAAFQHELDVARGKLGKASARHVQPHADTHRDPKLWRASRAFEALMIQQMLDAMRKTVPHSGLLRSGFAEDVQGSMFDQAVANAVSGEGGLGIAEAIYRQVSRTQGSPHPQARPESGDKKMTGAHPVKTRQEG